MSVPARSRAGRKIRMLALVLSFVVVLVDQIAKEAVRRRLFPGAIVPLVSGWFNLTHVRNTGAAWGMLGGLNGWLALLSVIILVSIVLFRRSYLSDTLTHRVALGLMIGGIVGNLIDRLRLHHVVDFLDFHFRGHHFPAFNLADSAICVGVGLYLLSSLGPLLQRSRPDGATAAEDASSARGSPGPDASRPSAPPA
jgi:signal peptidase II